MDRRNFIRMALIAPLAVKAAPLLKTIPEQAAVLNSAPVLTVEMLRRAVALMQSRPNMATEVYVHPAHVEQYKSLGYRVV